MIHVALMLPRLGRYGGAEQFGYRLAEYLATHPSRDFQVTYICAKQDGSPPDGVRVIKVGRPLPGKLGKTLWFALAAEMVRRKGHFDLCLGLGNSLVQDMLRLSGGPTKLFWEYSIRAYAPGFERNFKKLSRVLSPGKQLARIIEIIQAKHTPVLVANSHFVRDLTVRAFPWLDPESIPVIYNEPDLSRFRPAGGEQKSSLRHKFGLAGQAGLILTAGTNFRLKGVHVLIQALALLPKTFHLAVAGGRGSRELLKLSKDLGLAERVHFLGRVDAMPDLYPLADIFVLNTFYDACANAVLEALACGLPVVSTACNGSSAFLQEDAVLPDPGNVHALAQAIQKKIHGPSTARDDFSPPRGLSPYVDLIRKLA